MFDKKRKLWYTVDTAITIPDNELTYAAKQSITDYMRERWGHLAHFLSDHDNLETFEFYLKINGRIVRRIDAVEAFKIRRNSLLYHARYWLMAVTTGDDPLLTFFEVFRCQAYTTDSVRKQSYSKLIHAL